MTQRSWQKVIVKPAISASAHATMLVTPETLTEGQLHLNSYLSTHDMLVQPFLSTVSSIHERSLIFIDGTFTHAIERMPALNLDPTFNDRLIIPNSDEELLARKVLRLLPTCPLYARVDLIQDEEGNLRLMELELVEPGLWLSLAPHAVQIFADAIARKLNT